MSIETYTLSNGLRIIAAPSPTKVVYCGYAVAAGTRDEEECEEGMAHFVEHLIFKGTQKRKAWHILNRMESVGGDLNAFTTKEETIVYSVFLDKDFARALELLTDIVFHSTFPPNEIEKETEVILEEISSYEDTPGELIYDDFENMLYRPHPLGRNILGNPAQLKGFTTAHALRFTNRYYRPSNMVLFVHGNIPLKEIVRRAERLTTGLTAAKVEKSGAPLPPYLPQRLTLHKDTHQGHVLIGTRSYAACDERWIRSYLLNNLLGGPGMNSLLNVNLRERRGLVYTVESSLTNYTDTGVLGIYFGTEPKDIERCIELVLKELKGLCDTPLTQQRLTALKKQSIGEIGVSGDNFENIALEMGKIFLHYKEYETQESVFKRIEAVTAQELQETARDLFDEAKLSILIYR